MSEREHRKIVNAWVMYDWANSAFATTIMGAVFSPFYRSLVIGSGGGEAEATAYWAYTASAALVIVSMLGPILGAISDHGSNRKAFLSFFVGIGVASTAAFTLIPENSFLIASVVFIVGNVAYAAANIFYDSFLPRICKPEEMDRVSARGYAMGYVGGGLLLTVNALWIATPETFFMPDRDFAVRATFLSVAAWWGLFTIPLLRRVPERITTPQAVSETVVGGLRRLRTTFRRVRNYRQLLIFLFAFWVYNDGIGTVQKLAAAYGDEMGLELSTLLGALILSQFVGIPCALAFARLAGRFGTKTMIIAGLLVYSVIATGGYFMTTALHFYILAVGVGMVQGGIQSLSRSLYGRMVPQSQAAEFFGFFSTSAKFAGIFGPLLFGVVGQITGSSRLSIVSLIVFFSLGAVLLWRVDVEEGMAVAAREGISRQGKGI